MTVKTSYGRTYKMVGTHDRDQVFAPTDGKNTEVLIYTPSEVEELLEKGQFILVETEVTPTKLPN